MKPKRHTNDSPGKAYSDGFAAGYAKGREEREAEIRELTQDKAGLRDQLASLSKLHAKEAEAWERSREAEVAQLKAALAENVAMRGRPNHLGA